MSLRRRILSAGMTPPVARTFAQELRAVAHATGSIGPGEGALLARLCPPFEASVEAAPFEALWAHRELFLTACITVAVADGEYQIEQARAVSAHAHRLGYSAHVLSVLEAGVLGELRARGARQIQADRLQAAEDPMLLEPTEADHSLERTEPALPPQTGELTEPVSAPLSPLGQPAIAPEHTLGRPRRWVSPRRARRVDAEAPERGDVSDETTKVGGGVSPTIIPE